MGSVCCIYFPISACRCGLCLVPGRAVGTDSTATQCHYPWGCMGWLGLGEVPLVGLDSVLGLGWVLRYECLQSVLWFQGCCELAGLSSARDGRVWWVFHENSLQV